MHELPSATLGLLIRSLGEAGFPRLLLEAVNDVVAVGHLAIIAFDHKLTGHVVAAESVGRRPVAKSASHVYEAALLYRHDPSVQMITGRVQRSQHPLLFRLRAADIESAAYRAKIYDAFDLIERITMIDQFAGQWHATSFYRESEAGAFRPDDIAGLEAIGEVVAALVGKHFAMLPAPTWRHEGRPAVRQLEDIVRRLHHALTARQVQVCARALVGMTNQAIGLDLGIQAPTVATLRKRAYAVLKISSLNELFALCLGQSLPAMSEAGESVPAQKAARMRPRGLHRQRPAPGSVIRRA